MSPHAVNSLVTDLVQMAKAMEELPLVQDALEASMNKVRDYADLVAHREAEIKSLREQITSMAIRIQQAEANRDDAELRFLELEERASKTAHAFAMALTAVDLANAMAKDMTAKPQIEVMQPKLDPTAGNAAAESGVTTIAAATEQDGQSSLPSAVAEGPQEVTSPALGEAQSQDTVGERAADPTASGNPEESGSSAPSKSATISENASLPATTDSLPSAGLDDQPKPFANTTWAEWCDKPNYHYVPLQEWLDGGGTRKAYYS